MGSSNSTENKETNLNDYLTSLDLDFNDFKKQKMPVLDFKVGGSDNSYDKYNISNLLKERETTLNGGEFNNSDDFNTSTNNNSLSVNVFNALNNIQSGGDGSNDDMRNIINDELKEIMNGGMGCKCDKNNENCKCGNDISLSSTSDMKLSPDSIMGGSKKKKITTSTTSITSDSSKSSSNDENTSSTSVSSTSDSSTSDSLTINGGSESDNRDDNMSIKRGISVFPFESSEAGDSLSERNMRLLRKHL